MKAIIFGANGQDGHYLNKLCGKKNIQAICVSRYGSYIKGDVSKIDEVRELVKAHKPEYIFHLAATSSTHHDTLFENHETIATGTLNILESVYQYSPKSKVFLAGSGLQFENSGQPITENDEFFPSSPYSIARIQSTYAARYYRMLGIKVYIGYLFHHESPLRKPNHASQIIAKAVRNISSGFTEMITIGDVNVEKEWVYANDVVKAFFTLVEQDIVFEAVIGSGITYTIKEWIEYCFAVIGETNWSKYVKIKTDFTPEYKRLVSNPYTINSLGWTACVSIEKLAEMMVTYPAANSF